MNKKVNSQEQHGQSGTPRVAKSHDDKQRDRGLEMESYSAAEVNRIKSLPKMIPYAADDVSNAVDSFITSVSNEYAPLISKPSVIRLAKSYSFEWLEPRKTGFVISRSHELPGCVGDGISPSVSLSSCITSHFAMFVYYLSNSLPLPEPKNASGAARKSVRLTIRLTPEEMDRIQAEAELRSIKVSALARELLSVAATSPAEDSKIPTIGDLEHAIS